MSARLLIVDDDRAFRLSTAALLEEEGHEVAGASTGAEAVAALRDDAFDLVLMDLKMPGIDGIDVVEVLRTRGEGTPVLMISGYGTVDAAVRALHSGVDDFLTKPVEPEVLLERVASLLERRPQAAAGGSEGPAGLVGRSAPMQSVYDEIGRVAGTDATVLVTGETGTGKELVARAIHDASERRGGPFVAVTCAALAEGVLESELFGHMRGAFTGAVRDNEGLFRAAHRGTVFLDEVGDVPASAQKRLLRVLQEREVVPVGGVKAVPVDVRLVAATNRDLRAEMEAERFRPDLFFRLNVYQVELPPLRERRGDIALLVEHYLESKAGTAAPPTLSPLAMRPLLAHTWPGNVRQLLSVLESAVIRSEGGTIQAQHLPVEIRDRNDPSGAAPLSEPYRHGGSADRERDAIIEALRQAGGVRARAAQMLGMGRTTLWRKMREYGIEDD